VIQERGRAEREKRKRKWIRPQRQGAAWPAYFAIHEQASSASREKEWIRVRLSVRARQNLWGFVFALPAVGLFGVFAAYPILRTFYLSVFRYDLVATPEFVGLRNFRFILSDPDFRQVLGNTGFYALGTYGPVVVLALLVALALNTRVPFRNALRVVNFVPVVISWAIVAIIWKILFHQNGLINLGLSKFGIDAVTWLQDTTAAPWAVIVPSIWKELGFYMVIFLAGLQTIPGVYYEAARIDGANRLQSFRYITLPLLRPIIFFSTIIAVINGIKVFIPQFVMTGGGPNNATKVIAVGIYETAFAFGRMGRAAAMSVILFLIVLLLTWLQQRAYGRDTS
jgi:ABC-type sugar transport system permease subunit